MVLKAATLLEKGKTITRTDILNNSLIGIQYNQNKEILSLFDANTKSYLLYKKLHDSTSFDRIIYVKYTFGLGLGLNFGGIGLNVSKYFGTHSSAWCGIGSNLLRVGLSTGIKFHAFSTNYKRPINFYGLIMYGYHGITQKADMYFANTKIKTYYGFSFGGGLDLFQSQYGILSTGVIFPLYSQNFKNDHRFVEYQSILLNIGYIFTFQN